MLYTPAQIQWPDLGTISVLSEESLGARAARAISLAAPASITWVANLAVFVPFGISAPFLVREVAWLNGSAVASTNADVGVYDTAGVRLFSLGTTALSGVSVPQNSSGMTDYLLGPGDYYLAYANNGTTNNAGGWAPAAPLAAAFGVGQMASAFVLPTNATIVPLTNAVLPHVTLNGFTVAL